MSTEKEKETGVNLSNGKVLFAGWRFLPPISAFGLFSPLEKR
jgi:hypothetical protein